jgi:hypothetical protein
LKSGGMYLNHVNKQKKVKNRTREDLEKVKKAVDPNKEKC